MTRILDHGEILPSLRIAVVGHVDHGKSSLVGRLLHETDSLPDGKLAQIKEVSQRRGMPFEWAFVLDALQAERDQGITIDTTQIRFRTARRAYVLIDAPGHAEFLKNMVTGAAAADAALLVIDAHAGVEEQTRRHAYLLHLLGIRRVIGVVNKMDLVGYDERRFSDVRREVAGYLSRIGLPAEDVPLIPASAREGDSIAARSERMPWYGGPTLVAALDALPQPLPATELPLRLAVQDVYKFDDRRIIAGRIESGRLAIGDTLLFSPSGRTARIKTIEAWNVPAAPVAAATGQSVGITLDPPVFVERGHIASHAANPPIQTNVFRARLIWLGHEPLTPRRRYRLKLLTSEVEATVERIETVIDTGDLSRRSAARVARGEVAEIVLRSRSAVALDEFSANPRSGRFVLVDDYRIAGGGIISMEGYPDQRRAPTIKATNVTRVEPRVSLDERWDALGHKSGILWLTGLSGSGKSTLAVELERQLFAKGMHVVVLDGDNLRFGLNADLGFAPADRVENVRRAGEVAALFAKAGIVCITALISPYRADRDRIREAYPDLFHEIWLSATVEDCERRDAKGLYARARRGEIQDFTGISAPYEPPERPELVLDTGRESVDACLARLVGYAGAAFARSSAEVEA